MRKMLMLATAGGSDGPWPGAAFAAEVEGQDAEQGAPRGMMVFEPSAGEGSPRGDTVKFVANGQGPQRRDHQGHGFPADAAPFVG